ncbi:acyl-CoA/acyl-ACP dehydrogenase [Bacillus sp. RO2]|uniref:acyl-CoA dehydrogenase family protein n=1 Tax=Bacillus sp. RO2 TaxID=2723913 RepID=UPI00145C5404|nr:acyl-CoA dehydrogenase family protein [Bacillus sp. RO2]NMH73534.1 acyl-CoA/acyl-ACP dehydrogenase [Bacillus sp. RO2]
MNNVDILEYEKLMQVYANDFRNIGLIIDCYPEKIYEYLGEESLNILSRMMIPAPYNDSPVIINNNKYFGLTCLERVIAAEWLAYGDVGVLLASPGPSLSGIIINDLASEEHKDKYYSKLINKPTWTFFALSEPNKGSDANLMETNLLKTSADQYILNGEKYFIGNGSRGEIGVVFARSNQGPLGIDMVLVEKEMEGFTTETIDTLGLRGAELSHLSFKDCLINNNQIIGQHIRPFQRGMTGIINTFNKMRPSVAAMALGVSRAIYDYILDNRTSFTLEEKMKLEGFKFKIITTQRLIRQAAISIDSNPKLGYKASISKINAASLVKSLSQESLVMLGEGALYEHPLLNKWFRDSFGFEFMEGTSNIQKLNLFQSYMQGKVSYV